MNEEVRLRSRTIIENEEWNRSRIGIKKRGLESMSGSNFGTKMVKTGDQIS